MLPFASKLVNYLSRKSYFEVFEAKSLLKWIFSDLQRLIANRMIDRFGRKRSQKKQYLRTSNSCKVSLKNILFSENTEGRQILVHYIYVWSKVDSYFASFCRSTLESLISVHVRLINFEKTSTLHAPIRVCPLFLFLWIF